MGSGWLTALLNLLGMGGGPVTQTAGGLVCGTFACAPAVTGTFACAPAVTGTFAVEEC